MKSVKLKNIRRCILPNSMTIHPTREQFRNILSKADITLYTAIARFLHQTLKFRNTYRYTNV